MSPFNPFNPQTVFSLVACLVTSYAFGVVLVKNQLSGLANVGMRIGLGAVFATALVAVIQSNGSTVMLPVLILASIAAITNLVKERRLSFEDIRELSVYHWLTLVGIFSLFYLIEGLRLNVEHSGQVFIGNPDTAFYSGYGHSLFNTGRETIPEHHPEDTSSSLYHFGDLWMSGIISNLFGVLPYYANGLILRVLAMGAIGIIIWGWATEKTNRLVLLVLVVFAVLYGIVLQPPTFGEQVPMLFKWFRTEYPMYMKTSHLIIGICAVPILITQLKKGLTLVTCVGLLWLPLLNLGMILMPIFGMFFWSLFVLSFKGLRTKKNLQLLPVLIVASGVPALYCWATGRLPSPESHLSLGFIYVFLHTFLRALLSQTLLFPYIIGAFLFWLYSDYAVRKVVLFHVCLYLGTIVGFSYVFPQMQGNTYQLLTVHFQSVFAPLGVFGLLLLLERKRRFGVLGFALMLVFSFQHLASTKGFMVHYDWSYWGEAQKNYRKWATIPVSDALKMREMFAHLQRVKLGYFICNPNAHERAFQSSFVQLKGLIPGLELYRLNPLATDTTQSKELAIRIKRTAVGHEVLEEGRFEGVPSRLVELVEPVALIRPVADNYSLYLHVPKPSLSIDTTPNFCIPTEMYRHYPNSVPTNRFVFYFGAEKEPATAHFED